MANWKDNSTLLLLSEYIKKTKDAEIRKILVDSRRDFMSIRKGQEAKFRYLYYTIFLKINAYLGSKKVLTKKTYSDLYKLVDSLFNFLIGEQVYEVKNNLLRSIKAGAKVSDKLFYLAVKKSGVKVPENIIKNFDKLLLYETDKTFDLVFNLTWGRKRTTLSKKIWNSNKRSRKAIKKIIEYYENNKINDPRQLAKELEGYLSQKTPVSKKLRGLIPGIPKNVSYESLRVARSEINQGFTQSVYNTGKNSFGYEGIYWVNSSRHPEFDICTIYANTKKYGEKGFFPKNKEPKVPHPNCLCTQIPKYDLDSTIKALQGWEKDPNKYKEMDRYIKNLNRRAGQI